MFALLLLLASSAQGSFFKVDRERGTWWLVDPQGKKFFSRGVCGVSTGVALKSFDPAAPSWCALRFYPSAEKWRVATQGRLAKWGFNTLGPGADDSLVASGSMPFTVALSLGSAIGVPYTDPASLPSRGRIRELLSPLLGFRQNELLVGYYLDGQLGWWDESVVLHVMRQAAAKDPLKEKLMELLERSYRGDLRRFGEDFSVAPEPKAFVELRGSLRRAAFQPGRRPLLVEEFLEWIAGRYYRTMAEEVRKADPNHLILGDRYAGFYSQPVARAAGEHVDVVSTNYNTFSAQGWASPSYFESLYRLSRKPLLVSEIYFASAENRSGNRNRHGPYMTVPSQAERAAGAARLVRVLARFPSVVGVHWFQYADQPPEAEGEDFNMGLVDLKDVPYDGLTGALAKAWPEAERDHGTWPEGCGLSRAPQGLKVPVLTDLPIVDGSLDEWDLERAWVPDVKAVAPFERFGDIHVAWRPEGLALAVVYMDYRWRQRSLDGPEEDTERVTIGAGVDNEKPVVFTLKGLLERTDPEKPDSAFRTPEVLAVRGGVSFPSEGRFLVAQGQQGMSRIVEVFLPAALFRREKMDPAEVLRATVSLRLRANSKELFWPRPFKVSAWDSSEDWVPLVLDPAGLTEHSPAAVPGPSQSRGRTEPADASAVPVQPQSQGRTEPAGAAVSEPPQSQGGTEPAGTAATAAPAPKAPVAKSPAGKAAPAKTAAKRTAKAKAPAKKEPAAPAAR